MRGQPVPARNLAAIGLVLGGIFATASTVGDAWSPPEINEAEAETGSRLVRVFVDADGFHPDTVHVRKGEEITFALEATDGAANHSFTVDDLHLHVQTQPEHGLPSVEPERGGTVGTGGFGVFFAEPGRYGAYDQAGDARGVLVVEPADKGQ